MVIDEKFKSMFLTPVEDVLGLHPHEAGVSHEETGRGAS